MTGKRFVVLALAGIVALLAGCAVLDGAIISGLISRSASRDAVSAAPTPVPVGDAVSGAALFGRGINGAPACSTCHRIEPSSGGNSPFAIRLAPTLAGIGTFAAERVPGQTAAEYLYLSITHPGDYLVAGYRNQMYARYAERLTDAQIDDLVAYLLTLRADES